jgi:MFS family permease
MNDRNNTIVFWGCFIALIATAFGFITRMFLLDDPVITDTLGLDPAQVGAYKGIQVWPFALSIIIFSLIIDKVGYKFSMIFAFVCQAIWAVMGFFALSTIDSDPERAKFLIYWGGLILALGNGTVEAFINPVVATIFDKDKTKWLNILHAGWPGGLVVAGVLTIFMGQLELGWSIKLATIVVPVLIYFIMLVRVEFPRQERVAAGVSYKEMLSEFGILGAAVVGLLVTLQLMNFFPDGNRTLFICIGVAMVVLFGAYTKSLGRPLMFVLILIMMPLATTEIGTDGWITGIMKGVAADKFHAGWVLVYTSAIMMVLRFYAGPIVHKLSPLGLLAISCVLAIVGLYTLSFTAGLMIFAAATLYAVGKTFFWPTMLGVVSEQTPKGGALTLNAISGIGMLAVGTLGFPYIGTLQADRENVALVSNETVAKELPGLVENGELTVLEDKSIYEVIHYKTVSDESLNQLVEKLPKDDQSGVEKNIKQVRARSKQGALATMAIFPAIMLIGYILLILYFKARGGYKVQEISTDS